MSDFDELSTKEKQIINHVGKSMDKFYTLPTEKRQVALDNIVILNNNEPLSHLKG